MRAQLKEVSGAHRRELLVGFVRQEAMRTLGITETIDAARPLREFGLDSLASVTLANRLEAAIGTNVSTVKLIQGPSIDELVEEMLPDVMGPDDVAQPAQPEPSAGVWPVSAVTADADGVPQPIVLRPEHGAGGWPVVLDAMTGDEAQSKRIVIKPQRHAPNWLIIVGPRAAPRLRLFCFPFAGGGSVVYRSWARFIDPTVEVVAIEPPGRLGRITEPPIADMKEFVEQLVPEMEEMLDRPYAFLATAWAP